MTKILLIGSLGLLGIFCRYFIGVFVAHHFPSTFPCGTFFINMVGAFLIGVVYIVGTQRSLISSDLQIGLMAGFLGGFTTFSAYTLEAFKLLEKAQTFQGMFYLTLSPTLGLLAVWLGIFLGRTFIS